MKKSCIPLLLSLFFASSWAQESTSVYNFLSLPVSSHAAALGGTNISLIKDDASLAFSNPALFSSVSDKSLNFNFMTYISGSNVASASFTKIVNERSTFGLMGRYVDYGSFDETSSANETLGKFSAKDIAIEGAYCYNLTDYWAGGVTARMIYSGYADFNSFAMGVDVGLNYFHEEREFSFSAVARNLGGQLKPFEDTYERLPFDLQVGFTKGVLHAPIRISVTLVDLTRWSSSHYYTAEEKIGVGELLLNHVVLGVDIVPVKTVYLSAGYSFRRGNEMKVADASRGAGLAFGAGVQLSRFKLGIAYGKYHVAASSLLFNLSYVL